MTHDDAPDGSDETRGQAEAWLRRYVGRILGQPDLAHDVIQQAYLDIHDTYGWPLGTCSIPLLTATSINLARSRLRHEQVVANHRAAHPASETPDRVDLSELELMLMTAECHEHARAAIDALSDTLKSALMNCLDERPRRDIAAEMGITVKALELRLTRAIKAVRHHPRVRALTQAKDR